MILRQINNDCFVRINCVDEKDFLSVNGDSNYIVVVDLPFSRSGYYKRINDTFVIDEEKDNFIFAHDELNECLLYMSQTDWVEPYRLLHDLGVELLSPESNKLNIIAKREETRSRIRVLSEVVNAS